MEQVLHGSATTTEAVLRAIQPSQESLRALAGRYGVNQKAVAKWNRRTTFAAYSHPIRIEFIFGGVTETALLSFKTSVFVSH